MRQARLALLSLLLSAAGCPVRMVSDYDPILDQSASEALAKTDAMLTRIESQAGTPEAAYASNRPYYAEIKGLLATMRARASAVPKNENTLKQLGKADDAIKRLERMHKEGIKAEEVPDLRTGFTTLFSAIIRLEVDKKRGEKSGP